MMSPLWLLGMFTSCFGIYTVRVNYYVPGESLQFHLALCQPTSYCPGTGSAVCVKNGTKSWSAGLSPGTFQENVNASTGFSLSFKDGAPGCKNNFSSQIDFVCDLNSGIGTPILSSYDAANCVFTFVCFH